MSKPVSIQGDDVVLEGLLDDAGGSRAGVVAHPHPLYGGSMYNNVVDAACRALKQAGYSSLRFNFRGVGGSTGSHGQGIKEQDDIISAAAFLKESGAERLLTIGYSFGAWTAAFAWAGLKDKGSAPLMLIAPPAAFMEFDGLSPDTEIGLMICGEHDEIGPPRLGKELGRKLNNPVEPVVIPGADHFYSGRENKLIACLVEYISGL